MSCKICGIDSDLNECANCDEEICDTCGKNVDLDVVCSIECAQEYREG